jgi:hypothetical protein
MQDGNLIEDKEELEISVKTKNLQKNLFEVKAKHHATRNPKQNLAYTLFNVGLQVEVMLS